MSALERQMEVFMEGDNGLSKRRIRGRVEIGPDDPLYSVLQPSKEMLDALAAHERAAAEGRACVSTLLLD